MKFVNLLDKTVVVLSYSTQFELEERVIHPSSLRDQVGVISKFDHLENGWSFYKYQLDLPEPEKGTFYITERFIVAAHPERTDLVFCARNQAEEEGEVICCLGFGRF